MISFFSSIKRFVNEFIEYRHYIFYFIKTLQKSRVSNSFLGYLWWFLDPLLNMGIYIILVRMVFQQRDNNYPVFFFSAMLVWRYFSMAVQQAVPSIRDGVVLCKDNYIPKFMFPLSICISSLNPFFFSIFILFGFMIFLQIPITINILYLPLLCLALFLLTWACSMIVSHIDMFMNDFSNIVPHLITLGMFATPIFYDIDRIPEQYIFWMKLNPVGILTTSFRNIFVHGTPPPTLRVIYLILITILLILISIYILYKNDQIYNRINNR